MDKPKRRGGQRRTAVGRVTSDRMDKTIIVEAVRLTPHPLYGKYIKRVTKYRAHDEKNEARVGDRVSLMECRRMSRTKAWRLAEILDRAPRAGEAE